MARKLKRNKHSLSHYKLLTAPMGELVPVGCVEVLPGDTFQHQCSAMLRVSPLVSPVMHPVSVRLHHFYVPNRLVWDEWDKFITGESDTPVPTMTSTQSRLLDYLGVPPSYEGDINALPVRAYNKIYNEFYRDQDLGNERNEQAAGMANVAWEKDYFTTARPWPQKGDAVSIPINLSGDAPVRGIGVLASASASTARDVKETGGARTGVNTWVASEANQTHTIEDIGGNPAIYADLGGVSGVSITTEELREAFALQRYQEARARYGSRYTEYLAYLGVRASDARLQRPEYLGGSKASISFSEVLSTAESQNTEVGDLAGHGIAGLRSRPYRRFFEEHGYVLSLMSVRPKSIYADGLHRHWTRQSKEDYWQKELEALGQQPIQNSEVYAPHSDPTGTFGWVDRYREYREHPSSVHGEFRTLLNYWHQARIFESDPALNQSFIDCVPTDRIYADTNTDPLLINVRHKIAARRLVKQQGGFGNG